MTTKLLKKIYAKFLPKITKYPNVHSGNTNTRKISLPFCKNKVIIRKTRSDIARVCEYINEIYTTTGYLNNALIESKPKLVIDIGANIGLSTLSLIQHFETVQKTISVEGDEQNYSILSQNLSMWRKENSHVEFVGLNKIATNSTDTMFQQTRLSDEPNLTASGTIRFEPTKENSISKQSLDKCVTISKLLKDKSFEDGIILKVDIEGGEEYLFEGDTSWMKKISFITVELHDRYDPSLINTSKNILKSLLKYDFAIQPSADVLHCYNRRLIINE